MLLVHWSPCRYIMLSHDVASGSDITLCNKFDKPLEDNRFTGNVMTSIIMLRQDGNILTIQAKNAIFN